MPLRLTDLATVVAAYALWSQRYWACALTYYWGLILSSQALISPVLTGPDFPGYEFLAFWSIHLLVVWAAIYLTWGRGMRPTWRSYRLTATVTLSWATLTMAFNAVAGSNYGFLNEKPSTASLLDLMGPWPWYVVFATALVLTVWVRQRRDKRIERCRPATILGRRPIERPTRSPECRRDPNGSAPAARSVRPEPLSSQKH